uniref:Uncharacterized protein LOC105051884 isoform X4 n=1 Tax=Elaeis guineensis var. tenera TaxID=51953 RepID=A0A6I9RQQ4_ELAGV|nr:uncharacterized protein LOC105051884 isoform X4 [Elaeis guineensis]
MGLEIVEEELSAALPLPLMSLNHVSFVCRLFNYGVGIHLLQCNSPDDVPKKKGVINPKDNHISFQCSDINLLKHKLEEMGIEYVTAVVEDSGIQVDQLFFHDPDGYMVEICNCENLPVLPLSSCPLKFPYPKDPILSSLYGKGLPKFQCRPCGAEAECVIMENLVTDMMDISF